MAAATSKTYCVTCKKEKVTFKCGGCSEDFCYQHLGDHQLELSKQFDEIEVNRDIFRQSLTEHIEQSNNDDLFEQIDRWAQRSIEIIQQTAEETKRTLIETKNQYFQELELKLSKLTEQLRQKRQENDFNEISLRNFHEELNQLTKELAESLTISIGEESTSFLSKLYVDTSELSLFEFDLKNFEVHSGLTVAGGNGMGSELDQLSRPVGIFVDNEQTVYVADNENHRIVEWKLGARTGRVVAGGNGQGKQTNQLSGPTDIAISKDGTHFIICDQGNKRVVSWPRRNGTNGQVLISNIDCCRISIDKQGYFYISDREKHEVRRWKANDTSGRLVAGGNGKGDRLDQLNNPTFIFVHDDNSIYISDWGNHRVVRWIEGAKEGVIVAGGHGKGNSLMQLANPQGVVVDDISSVFVADFTNNRIMCWCKDAVHGNVVVGRYGQGDEADQLNRPMGLSLNQQGDLFVVDQWNVRVQRFDFDRK
ncbi:unnamed protein product [Adineta ricciae]|uniref:Uncharacterized protein n=1 Tax=Adineta ricciae TaxID=249248 RepID=A0A814Y4N0_ADIRI|nr:unnamed protein product [Adineta ricciae]CAF1257355.1 unnamed protein product [Adineta ricciae]